MGRKITEILTGINKFTYSFEITPDISVEEIDRLETKPSFYSITWHAKLYSFENLDIAPIKLATYLSDKKETVLLHLSCDKLKRAYLDRLLEYLKTKDIHNLFLIQGEGFDAQSSDFKFTLELLNYIRHHSGNYFCIGIAGHCDKGNTLTNLKEKVKAGADFILTQAFFEAENFKTYSAECRKIGIYVPIIPGIFPYETQQDIERFIQLCKINTEKTDMKTILSKSGLDVIKDLIQQLYTEMDVKHFHIYTMNKLQRTLKLITTLN